MAELIGKYAVAKTFFAIGDDVALFTREEVEADLEAKIASGDMEREEASEYLGIFDALYEFTTDGKINTWMKLPEDVSEEEIREAVEAGEIAAVDNGYMLAEQKEWFEEDGKFFYDTEEYREIAGEEQSSVDELTFDEEGLLNFGSGMVKLKKI
ncbi:MAG: hypothetical protein IJS45_11305 [Clostridia bacterium]|nr:hypothetical protein [Clostridia bacterium]